MEVKSPLMYSSDAQLFERIKRNDYGAYTQLYNKYQKPLLHFTSGYIQDAYYREEIVQEFFMQLWIKRETIQIRRSLSSYLYRSIRNKILNHIRNQSTYKKYFFLADLPDIRSEEDIHRGIDSSDLAKDIDHLLYQMPDKYKEVYVLRVRHRLTIKRTAQMLNRSINTVDKQIRKVIAVLQEHLNRTS
jgi:RNA polymerase sigma-70 factor (ECF subfamily)